MALDLTTPAEAIAEASSLFSGLAVGLPTLPTFPLPPTVTIPDMPVLPADLITVIASPSLDELTQGAVAGSGVFDRIMSALSAHIESQYKNNVLAQSDVAKVYVAAIEATLPQAVSFLLGSQEAYWRTKLLQIQTQNAYLERSKIEAELQTAKLVAYQAQAQAYTAQVQSLTAQVTYTNGKLQLVSTLQDVNSKETQEAIAQEQYNAAYVMTHDLLPGGATPGGTVAKDLLLKTEQITLTEKQQDLMTAQTNVQRAQTYDTNTDLTPVVGIIGAQKNLYNQQIQSYQQDGMNKGVKLIADLWTSAKALDDAIQSPGPLAGNTMMALNTYLNELGLPNAMVSADTPASGAPSTDTDWNVPGKQS